MKERCIVIPAIKKNAVIPDQLVKKLAGVPLINRAITTARASVPPEDIHVLTDSEEIGVICERAGVSHVRDPALKFQGHDIVSQMRNLLENLAVKYENCIILRASCPLLTWVDIEDAWNAFKASNADSLVTVRKNRQRLWRARQDQQDLILLAADDKAAEQNLVIESRALILLKLGQFQKPCPVKEQKIIPWFLNERSIEIQDYQDWWICEKLLKRRHVVFVVAGYPAIGMGHVFRALMLAHEINDHKITFVCTRESELAVENVARRDYDVVRQGKEDLADTVLAQRPDLVINDFLDTPVSYMRKLHEHGITCINFEDMGAGANLAAEVINALYEERPAKPHRHAGSDFFCLRDEFLFAARNPLNEEVRTLLITFGGTDQHNCTERVLNIVEPVCREKGISIRIVTGPGYAHTESLKKRLLELANPNIIFTKATNIMSKMMEGADLAICSAGRTVYELAHMRVPSIVLATHEREATHTFGRPENGFSFAGIMDKVDDKTILAHFLDILQPEKRSAYWHRQDKLDFTKNKARVIKIMLDHLEKEHNGNDL